MIEDRRRGRKINGFSEIGRRDKNEVCENMSIMRYDGTLPTILEMMFP